MKKYTKLLSLCLATFLLTSCGFQFPDYDSSYSMDISLDDSSDTSSDSSDNSSDSSSEDSSIKPTSIALNETNLFLNVGETSTLTCSILPEDADNKEITWTSKNASIASVENGVVTAVSKGSTTITVASVAAPTVTATCTVNVTQPDGKTKLKYTYEDIINNSVYNISALPQKGEPKVLVIPVWFNDSNEIISTSKKDRVKSDIEKAYFGTEEETGWHSVSSYYYEESRGTLDMKGVVSNWYECGKNASYYNSTERTSRLVKDATNWYFTENPSESKLDYDYDNDGYLDGVMLIYAYPDYISLGNDSYDNLWAYCYWVQEPSLCNKSNPGPNVFFWASYDFMYGYNNQINSNYYHGDTRYCTIDAHTYIHEMGHVLGLKDYYDYSGQTSPAGGFSMQDHNVGGHDPFSVMSLGWVDPIVVTGEGEYDIGPFQTTGDLILVANPTFDNSPFDEYILVELFSPNGLNAFDCTHKYSNAYPQGPTCLKVRMWHVDAKLISYNTRNVTTNPKDGYVEAALTNTCYKEGYESRMSPLGEDYYDYNFLQLIRKSPSATYKANDNLTEGILFGEGTRFNMTAYSSQFKNGTKLDWGDSFPFNIAVTSINGGIAKITITK